MPLPPAVTSSSTTPSPLTFTGERFLPEVHGPIWYEHWHRYVAVAPLARGKRVLDAACGEGYGSFLLAQRAQATTGVDVSADAIAHARTRYARPGLAFVAASVAALPLPTASVDLVISFETIEHLTAQREMLAEFRRVLAPEGILVISSPNRPVYNEDGGVENHYHVRELDRNELRALLDPVFPRQAWYAQRVIAQSALWAEAPAAAGASFVALARDQPTAAPAPAPPMYFVVVASAADVVLPRLPDLSLFDDGAQALWHDYERTVLNEKHLEWEVRDARKVADEREGRLVEAVNALASERQAGAARAQRIAALEGELAQLQGRLVHELQTHAQAADALAREQSAHADTRARLAYRESMRGWLRYPLAAARRRTTGP